MIEQPPRLLELLADGAFHSGAVLGRIAGCSRAAIWKQVRQLRAMGLEIEASRSAGYRLTSPLERLRSELILEALPPSSRAAIDSFEVVFSIDSTSNHLMRLAPPGPGRCRICIAEFQTGGRGRRGREWRSPPGRGICLSLSWCYDRTPVQIATLGLALGVGIAESLETLGVEGIRLKWPNDIVTNGGKLGGILVDVAGESGGPLKVVTGIGINVHEAPVLDVAADGGLPPACLAGSDRWPGISRNIIASTLIAAVRDVFRTFGRDGVAAFTAGWRLRDALHGRPVMARAGGRTIAGVAKGIADDGSLLVEQPGGITAVYAGDVTLRDLA